MNMPMYVSKGFTPSDIIYGIKNIKEYRACSIYNTIYDSDRFRIIEKRIPSDVSTAAIVPWPYDRLGIQRATNNYDYTYFYILMDDIRRKVIIDVCGEEEEYDYDYFNTQELMLITQLTENFVLEEK